MRTSNVEREDELSHLGHVLRCWTRFGFIEKEFPRPFVLKHLPEEQTLHEIIGVIRVVVAPCLGIYKKVSPHVEQHITEVDKARMKGLAVLLDRHLGEGGACFSSRSDGVIKHG